MVGILALTEQTSGLEQEEELVPEPVGAQLLIDVEVMSVYPESA